TRLGKHHRSGTLGVDQQDPQSANHRHHGTDASYVYLRTQSSDKQAHNKTHQKDEGQHTGQESITGADTNTLRPDSFHITKASFRQHSRFFRCYAETRVVAGLRVDMKLQLPMDLIFNRGFARAAD